MTWQSVQPHHKDSRGELPPPRLVLFTFLLSVLLFLAAGCSAFNPQLRFDVNADGTGYFSIESVSIGGISDTPVRAVLEALRLQYANAGIPAEITTLTRSDKNWLALRAPFKNQTELRRITGLSVSIPASALDGLPEQARPLVPDTLSLSDVSLTAEPGVLGSKSFVFQASVDPAVARSLEAAGVSIRVSLPGSISSTNGRQVDGDVTWPGPAGWPQRLEARSQLGIFGMDWGWLSTVAMLLVGLGVVGGVVLFARARRLRSAVADDGEYGYDSKQY